MAHEKMLGVMIALVMMALELGEEGSEVNMIRESGGFFTRRRSGNAKLIRF